MAFEAARDKFLAGVAAFERNALAQAEALFVESLALLPGRASTLVNLAAVRLRLGRPAEALNALDQAVHSAPDDVAAWFDRGNLLGQLQRPREALQSFERVTALDPAHGRAWSQRGAILKDMGQREQAAECFSQALAHGGDVELNRYFLASVQADVTAPQAAPAGYVEALFDSYADDFDSHLVDKLGYRTPRLLVDLLRAQGGLAPARGAALDLGCGTGLFGPLVAPLVSAVDGVDLSSRMLDKARERGCYRHLHQAEVVQHLEQTSERYALVAAADVFVYIGDLAPVFNAVSQVLERGGLFLFSVEVAEAETTNFKLRASSRYAHAEPYLRELTRAAGLNWKASERSVLRHEQREPIEGLLVLLQAPET